MMTRISRFSLVLPVAMLGAALIAPLASAQRRGTHPVEAGSRSRPSFRGGGREGLPRFAQRRFLNEPAFLFPPYLYPDDEFEYGPAGQESAPVQVIMAQPASPPAPAPIPGESLLLENRDGQWVRIPTGGEMQAGSNNPTPNSALASSLRPGIAELAVSAPPLPAMPRATIVFRDGHSEELEKYFIQGDTLYTKVDSWSIGPLARRILLADLDIPASLRLNKDRGTKFNLPSGPNEVVVRF
jgi:hypothetical protein